MAYIGNGPGVASQRITTSLTATSNQTTFTPTSGYTVGYVDVYLNGVRLVNGTDYTASNGTTVVLASGAAENDVLEVVAYLPRGLSDGYTKAEADSRYMSASATTLPSQTDNSGKFLTTDGTDASWATINVSPTPADVSDQANTSTGYFDLPAGTTAQRPGSPASGMVRFNTEIGEPEWYEPAGSQWLKFSQGANYSVEYLVVAGGGGGAALFGGGGAGGLINASEIVTPTTVYSVIVGIGGPGGPSATDSPNEGSNGTPSSVFGVTAAGGGFGGADRAGEPGGSGGGGGSWSGILYLGGAGTSGQGFAGGNGSGGGNNHGGGGGGGGATSVGANGTTTHGGNGGSGSSAFSTWAGATSTGANGAYAGGGGGGVYIGTGTTAGAGGLGGGGAGGAAPGNSGTPGTQYTGGGGGGGTRTSQNVGGGQGGSGIVILRYLGSQRGLGGTVTSSGGYTYHTFTSSGSFTA